ncbi:MAG: hypothetical protein QM586_03080 [Xenophilus sp.]
MNMPPSLTETFGRRASHHAGFPGRKHLIPAAGIRAEADPPAAMPQDDGQFRVGVGDLRHLGQLVKGKAFSRR